MWERGVQANGKPSIELSHDHMKKEKHEALCCVQRTSRVGAEGPTHNFSSIITMEEKEETKKLLASGQTQRFLNTWGATLDPPLPVTALTNPSLLPAVTDSSHPTRWDPNRLMD